MQIHISLILPDISAHYKINNLVDRDSWLYTEIIWGVDGIPQAVIIANNLLTQCLGNHRYYQVKHTPGFWCHVWNPISSTLVVNNFGIEYVGREQADNLMSALNIYDEKLQQIGKGS